MTSIARLIRNTVLALGVGVGMVLAGLSLADLLGLRHQRGILLVLQACFGAALFWSCFCRLTLTGPHTIREVRWAIWFQSVASMLVLGAPVLPVLVPSLNWRPWSTPAWIWVTLLVAVTLLQIINARAWRHGVPDVFTDPAPLGER